MAWNTCDFVFVIVVIVVMFLIVMMKVVMMVVAMVFNVFVNCVRVMMMFYVIRYMYDDMFMMWSVNYTKPSACYEHKQCYYLWQNGGERAKWKPNNSISNVNVFPHHTTEY